MKQFYMENVSKPKPSIYIKIAAFIFLVSGLISLFGSSTRLSVSVVQSEILGAGTTEIIYAATIIISALYMITGWYSMNLKRWAYILGLVVAVIVFISHIFELIQTGSVNIIGLAITVILIILMIIIGKKDFKFSIK